jgi:CAAX amino terminal protease family.
MTLRIPKPSHVAITIGLAFVFWAAVFAFHLVNFWAGLSGAALVLTALSFIWGGIPVSREEITLRNTLVGLGSAAVLYGIFFVCKLIAAKVFAFAPGQIHNIYTIRTEADALSIAIVLLFITSPCEELFWRGFVQRFGMARFGAVKGWLFGTFFYTVIHVSSGNFMLTGAAFTAGLFWGYLYARTNSVYACIVSHASWTVAIFLLFPMT